MTTWATLRDSIVRPLLKDTASAKKWSDAELLTYGNFGLDDLSSHAPLTKFVTLATDGATYSWALPTDHMAPVALSWRYNGRTEYLKRLRIEEGDIWPFATPTGQSEPLGYMLDWPEDGTLTLTRLAGSGVTLAYVYLAYRPHVTESTDELPTGSAVWMEQALAFYICYMAHLREGVSRAGLEQWSMKPENVVGNPLNLEARMWLEQYNRLVNKHEPRDP